MYACAYSPNPTRMCWSSLASKNPTNSSSHFNEPLLQQTCGRREGGNWRHNKYFISYVCAKTNLLFEGKLAAIPRKKHLRSSRQWSFLRRQHVCLTASCCLISSTGWAIWSVKTSCWLSSDSHGSWRATSVATYAQVAKNPQIKVNGRFQLTRRVTPVSSNGPRSAFLNWVENGSCRDWPTVRRTERWICEYTTISVFFLFGLWWRANSANETKWRSA